MVAVPTCVVALAMLLVGQVPASEAIAPAVPQLHEGAPAFVLMRQYRQRGETVPPAESLQVVDDQGVVQADLLALEQARGEEAPGYRWFVLPEVPERSFMIFKGGELVSRPYRVEPAPKRLHDAEKLADRVGQETLLRVIWAEDVLDPAPDVDQWIRDLATAYDDTIYGRLANLMLGIREFKRIEAQVNNDGPANAYASCYRYLEAARGSQARDPIWARATYHLMIAKALSSSYGEASLLADELLRSESPSNWRKMAERARAELPRLKSERRGPNQ